MIHEPGSKPGVVGVYVSRHLNFTTIGKAAREDAMVANRTREIRPSGMTPGACGNVSYGGIRNPPHIPKGCVNRKLST